jgi:hypothetical protein
MLRHLVLDMRPAPGGVRQVGREPERPVGGQRN